jgi:hypothetical protein
VTDLADASGLPFELQVQTFAKGWKVVAQQRPGWHEWHTPSGRVYVQEPKRYPA